MKKRNTLSYKQLIRAKCKDCMCGYVDGRRDCEVETCPLYPAMPYGKLKRKNTPIAPPVSKYGTSLNRGEPDFTYRG